MNRITTGVIASLLIVVAVLAWATGKTEVFAGIHSGTVQKKIPAGGAAVACGENG